MRIRDLRRLALVVAVGCLPSAQAASAADYPARPIRLVVPFTPGGTTDILARVLGARLGEVLGQSVVVENRPGAGGNVGAEAVARAAPDGYTLLMGTLGTQVTNQYLYARMPYDAAKDFAPVTLVANSPNVLLTNAAQPVRSVADVIALRRRSRGASTTRPPAPAARRTCRANCSPAWRVSGCSTCRTRARRPR
ncbi:tripartite-type tricarboxylate transporter receptor subunit TctC [Cupriavidus necator]|nr:tripartite-type tricarboxylate transporter receptor subunit TctC [Cupriavidus necator]